MFLVGKLCLALYQRNGYLCRRRLLLGVIAKRTREKLRRQVEFRSRTIPSCVWIHRMRNTGQQTPQANFYLPALLRPYRFSETFCWSKNVSTTTLCRIKFSISKFSFHSNGKTYVREFRKFVVSCLRQQILGFPFYNTR